MAKDNESPLPPIPGSTGLDAGSSTPEQEPVSPTSHTSHTTFHTPMYEEPAPLFTPVVLNEMHEPSFHAGIPRHDGKQAPTPASTASSFHMPPAPAPSAETTGPSTPVPGSQYNLAITPSRYEVETTGLTLSNKGCHDSSAEPKGVAPASTDKALPVPTTVEVGRANPLPALPPKTPPKTNLIVNTGVADSPPKGAADLPKRSSSLPENRDSDDEGSIGSTPCFETCQPECMRHTGPLTASPKEIVPPPMDKDEVKVAHPTTITDTEDDPKNRNENNYYANDPYAKKQHKDEGANAGVVTESPLPQLPEPTESPLPALPEPTDLGHGTRRHPDSPGLHGSWMRRLFRKMKL